MARQTKPAHWTPSQWAAYDLVHNFKADGLKGPAAMAPNLGLKTPRVLSNEVNADCRDHKFGLEDAITAEIAAGVYPILHAHAHMVRHVCFPLPDPCMPYGDAAILEKFAEWQAKMGRTCERIRAALDPDGPKGSRITHEEVAEIERFGEMHVAGFMEFIEVIKTLAE
jgi:hypothetical protein